MDSTPHYAMAKIHKRCNNSLLKRLNVRSEAFLPKTEILISQLYVML